MADSGTLKALREFLGLTSFYQKFVPKYSTKAAPLTDLLRKDAFIWTLAAVTVFKQLKSTMMCTLVLAPPVFTMLFTI